MLLLIILSLIIVTFLFRDVITKKDKTQKENALYFFIVSGFPITIFLICAEEFPVFFAESVYKNWKTLLIAIFTVVLVKLFVTKDDKNKSKPLAYTFANIAMFVALISASNKIFLGGTLEENMRSLRSSSSFGSLGGSIGNNKTVLVDIPKDGKFSHIVSYHKPFNYTLLDRGVWIKIHFYDNRGREVSVIDNSNSNTDKKIDNRATHFAVRIDERSVGKCIYCQIMIEYKY